MKNSLKEFEDQCSRIKCNFTTSALDKLQKNTSCECSHNARVLQFEGEKIRAQILLCSIIGLFFVVAVLFYLVGLAKGAYYAVTFGTGGCYSNMFWDSDCEVIF